MPQCKVCGKRFQKRVAWKLAQHVRLEHPKPTAAEIRTTFNGGEKQDAPVSVTLRSNDVIEHAKQVLERATSATVQTDGNVVFILQPQ